jgi:UDPglucose--hexose-1-phosphate uridylyltransferase
MSELRFDPLKRRWVIVAEERALKPADLVREQPQLPARNCPLCPGNEQHTGHEILRIPSGSGTPSPWRVRVVPNKFPILRVEGALERTGHGLYDVVSGVGAHEVIVETPAHDRSTADLSVEELRDVLAAFRARLADLKRDQRLRYLMLFKNHGVEAGSRLDHAHSQLVAIPEIPMQIAAELRSTRDYFRHKERCLLCDVIRQERADGERVVLETARFIAFAPFASAFPFQVTLAPRGHAHDFTTLGDEDLLQLGSTLRDVLRRVRTVLEDPPYNLALHTAPPDHPRPGRPGLWDSLHLDWHWHLEIAPRLTHIAGFEWSTGFHINPVTPEAAAGFLREAAG